nr:Chain C, 9-mer peptide from Tyrosinase-related protein-2 [Homo sapiens]
SVYDFFVWL